jgi:LemA protein
MQAVVLIIAVLLFSLIFMGMYNKLIRFRNLVKNSFSQIDVQLKRRYDLIPNLVETAKAYMAHEKNTLEAVIKARNQAYAASSTLASNPANADSMKQFAGAENSLTGALSRLMVVAEQYPDLKANTTMNQLIEELTSTENKISFARQAFNDSVMEYNNAREQFPSSVIANFFNFQSAAPFEITKAEEKETVKVSFA